MSVSTNVAISKLLFKLHESNDSLVIDSPDNHSAKWIVGTETRLLDTAIEYDEDYFVALNKISKKYIEDEIATTDRLAVMLQALAILAGNSNSNIGIKWDGKLYSITIRSASAIFLEDSLERAIEVCVQSRNTWNQKNA